MHFNFYSLNVSLIPTQSLVCSFHYVLVPVDAYFVVHIMNFISADVFLDLFGFYLGFGTKPQC
jgi:hypothetical protein